MVVDQQVALKPGQRWKLEAGSEAALAAKVKASVGAKVEHPLLDLKRPLGYAKVRTGAWPRTRSAWSCCWG